MIDPRTCQHPHHEPVNVTDPLTGEVETVARICTDCYDQLSIAWGCRWCDWVDVRGLCDPVPRLLLSRPCPDHSGAKADLVQVVTKQPDKPGARPRVRVTLLADAPANLHAPTVAELNAGIDLTPYLEQPDGA